MTDLAHRPPPFEPGPATFQRANAGIEPPNTLPHLLCFTDCGESRGRREITRVLFPRARTRGHCYITDVQTADTSRPSVSLSLARRLLSRLREGFRNLFHSYALEWCCFYSSRSVEWLVDDNCATRWESRWCTFGNSILRY